MINLRYASCELLFLNVFDITRYSIFTQYAITLLISVLFKLLDLSINLKIMDLIISFGINRDTSTSFDKDDWSWSAIVRSPVPIILRPISHILFAFLHMKSWWITVSGSPQIVHLLSVEMPNLKRLSWHQISLYRTFNLIARRVGFLILHKLCQVVLISPKKDLSIGYLSAG